MTASRSGERAITSSAFLPLSPLDHVLTELPPIIPLPCPAPPYPRPHLHRLSPSRAVSTSLSSLGSRSLPARTAMKPCTECCDSTAFFVKEERSGKELLLFRDVEPGAFRSPPSLSLFLLLLLERPTRPLLPPPPPSSCVDRLDKEGDRPQPQHLEARGVQNRHWNARHTFPWMLISGSSPS